MNDRTEARQLPKIAAFRSRAATKTGEATFSSLSLCEIAHRLSRKAVTESPSTRKCATLEQRTSKYRYS
jgi:hypothetical protein